jgi:hypothetical protein
MGGGISLLLGRSLPGDGAFSPELLYIIDLLLKLASFRTHRSDCGVPVLVFCTNAEPPGRESRSEHIP